MNKIVYRLIGLVIVLTGNFSFVFAQENASNPLAAVSGTDLRYQYKSIDGSSHLSDIWIDGSYMATPKLKLKYELHYWSNDISGSQVSGFQSFHFKPVYFPLQGEWGSWKYKLSVGLEWIMEFGPPQNSSCAENPIFCIPPGVESDQLGPFLGLSMVTPKGTVLVPLVQQFFNYNGAAVNITAFRLIGIQPLPNGFWAKLDFAIPYDWENNITPADAEIQLGKMFKPFFGAYFDLMAGIGNNKPYDWGLGAGVRFNY